MIGQKLILEDVHKQISEGTFPRFSIIRGMKGSGKRTLVKEITEAFNTPLVYESKIGVADIREAIAQMYKVSDTAIFVFYDVDNMSIQAKNALLKVTEEPPNNVYIIMTLSDIMSMLETVRSRARIYTLQPYTKDELLDYAHKVMRAKFDDELLLKLCETPGEIKLFYERDGEALFDYAYKAVENIAVVSGANAFKMANQIAFKEEDEGFDMKLFLKAFRQICSDNLISAAEHENKAEVKRYMNGITVVNRIIQHLRINGINKVALFDMFILDIRKMWM